MRRRDLVAGMLANTTASALRAVTLLIAPRMGITNRLRRTRILAPPAPEKSKAAPACHRDLEAIVKGALDVMV